MTDNQITEMLAGMTIDELSRVIEQADKIKTNTKNARKNTIKEEIIELLKELKTCDNSYMYFPVEVEVTSEDVRYGDFIENDICITINDIINMVNSL